MAYSGDPGFSVVGRLPGRGGTTADAVTFRKICMSKRKNWDPWSVPWIHHWNNSSPMAHGSLVPANVII